MTIDGATFALDAPAQVDAVWGKGSRVPWAKGEPLMIAKPDGVGGSALFGMDRWDIERPRAGTPLRVLTAVSEVAGIVPAGRALSLC